VNPDGSVILSGQFFIDFAAVINDLEVVRYEEDTLETVQGTIRMLPTKAVKPGETYFRLEKNGQLLRGLAKQSIQTAGFEASVDRDCDFWFFADGNGLQRIKPTKPCNLKLSLQKLPAEIFLTDPLTGGDRKLAWTAEGNTIALQVEPWQAYYWIRLVY